MKFTTTTILFGIFATVAQAAQCQIGLSIDPNCCWGGSAGSDACSRQAGGVSCLNGSQNDNFCINMGIGRDQCDADCCDTRTGKGKPCPKGKNRCDADSGCPY